MATTPRATLFFKQGDFGWSETHHYKLPAETLTPVMEEAKKMAKKRSYLLGVGVLLQSIRVSFDDTWRDSLVEAGPIASLIKDPLGVLDPLPYYNPDAKGFKADEPYIAVTTRLEMGEAYRKLVYLSGVPTGLRNTGGRQGWPDWFDAAWLEWAKYMAGINGPGTPTAPVRLWGSVVRSKGVSDNTVRMNDLAFTDPANLIISTGTPHNLRKGDTVRILGCKQDPRQPKVKINGTWYVAEIGSGTEFQIKPNTLPATFKVVTTLGSVEKITPLLVAYNDYDFDSITHRKRGRSFDSPRGRTKKPTSRSV